MTFPVLCHPIQVMTSEVLVQSEQMALGIEEQVEMNLEQVVLAIEEEPVGLE